MIASAARLSRLSSLPGVSIVISRAWPRRPDRHPAGGAQRVDERSQKRRGAIIAACEAWRQVSAKLTSGLRRE
jgi:hypothetical protein